MSNSKTNVADLYAGKLKSLPESSKKLSHVVSKELVKNTKNKKKIKNTKVNNLEKEIPTTTDLIHINQYNTQHYNLDKKIDDVNKKLPYADSVMLQLFLL